MTLTAGLLMLSLLSPTPICSQPHLVTIDETNIPVVEALRTIGEQAALNFGIRKGFYGQVSVTFHCVRPEVALHAVLAQVNGAYCKENGSIYIDRADRLQCSGRVTWPSPTRLAEGVVAE